MRFRFNNLFGLLALLLCVGCSNHRVALGAPPIPTAASASAGGGSVPIQADYRIGPRDTLMVKVLGEPDLSVQEQPVELEGTFSMPLLGQIPAAGHTAAELTQMITDGLNRRYLRDAQVSVAVVQAINYTVTLTGQVKKTGVYPIPGRLTLLQAIALGEGFTGDANTEDVIIIRQINGQRYAARFPVRDIESAQLADPMLQQSDEIIVGTSGRSQLVHNLALVLPGLAAVAGVFLAFR